jgi:hypothetical protein
MTWTTAAEREEDADDRVRDALRAENHYSWGVTEDEIAQRCEDAGYEHTRSAGK